MRAKYVNESLDRFALLDNDFLAVSVLNEKLNINDISNFGKKTAVLTSMFLMFAVGKSPGIQNKLPDKEKIKNSAEMIDMAKQDHLSRDEVFKGFEDMLDLYQEKDKKTQVFSAGDIIEGKGSPYRNKSFIETVNNVKPGRLNPEKIDQYDSCDSDIIRAIDHLKSIGEKPDGNIIKAIMLIETGMNPVKNKWGYEGFPQTKKHTIESVNKRNGTNFTIDDMYNAEKSAEFIHYYLKTVQKSKHVNNLEDSIIAYNWGVGNLGAFKRGEKELAKQPKDYVKMLKAMQKHFVPQT